MGAGLTELEHPMKLALFASLVVLATLALAQSGEQARRELKGKTNGHYYRVLLRARDAKGDGRKITFMPPSDPVIRSDGILINGAQTFGFDGISLNMAPKGTTARQTLEKYATEIIQFQVWIDGKRISVSRRKHETMLQPRLDTVSAELSKDGKKLTVMMSGSDGAGSWTAVWSIQRSGKVDVSVGGGG